MTTAPRSLAEEFLNEGARSSLKQSNLLLFEGVLVPRFPVEGLLLLQNIRFVNLLRPIRLEHPAVQIDPFAAGSASAKWHAAKWLGVTSRSGGSSSMQTSFV